jgi:hypothetical protein
MLLAWVTEAVTMFVDWNRGKGVEYELICVSQFNKEMCRQSIYRCSKC